MNQDYLNKICSLNKNLCVIHFITLNGYNIFVVAKYYETKIKEILEKFLENYNIKMPNKVQFFSEDLKKYLEDEYLDKTLFDLNIKRNTKVKLEYNWSLMNNKVLEQIDNKVEEINKNMDKEKIVNIKIKTLNELVKDIKIDPNINVLELKTLISIIFNKKIEEQRLIYKGRQLYDYRLLNDVQEGDILTLVYALRGGMFHETSGKDGNFKCLKDCILFIDNI